MQTSPFMQYQPQQYPQRQVPQYPAGSAPKVNGPNAALQYALFPGMESPPLFDYDGRQFYIVTADAAGFKTVEAFDFKLHVEAAPAPVVVNGVEFSSQSEFDRIAAAVAAVMESADGIHGPVPEAGARPAAKHSVPDGS